MKKSFIALFTAALLVAALPAAARYIYIHNDGEYSVELPDAPLGKTIWADKDKIPYLDRPPRMGAMGEYATLRRVDSSTGDYFDVHITFLRASKSFIDSLTKEKLLGFLENDLKDIQLQKSARGFSEKEKLKWATLTGYSVDKSNNLLFNAANFLVGVDTITVIRVQYSLENNEFNEAYKRLNKSIRYVGK